MSKVFLVRLHVIQFTRYRRCSHKLSLAANFYMLSQLLSFVKHFFKFLKTFLKHFKRIFSCECSPPSQRPFIRQLLYVSIPSRICQELFSILFKFLFNLPRCSLSRTACIYYHRNPHLSTRKKSPFRHRFGHFQLSWHFCIPDAKGPGAYAPGPYYII